MHKFNKPATHVYMAPADDGSDLGGAQDIEQRIASALFPDADDGGQEEQQDDSLLDEDSDLLPNDDTDSDAKDDLPGEEPEADDEGEVTIASILGVDEDKLEYDENGAVVFNAIIDGKAEKVPFNELVKSYQLQGHVNNKSMQLETDKKEFSTTRDSAYKELTARLVGLNKLTEVAEKALMEDYEGIDWNSLRLSEPGEWAALQQQFKQRADKIVQIKQLALQEHERVNQDSQKQFQAANQERINGEFAKMVVDNPTWSDQSVMVKEFGEIGAFLRDKYGFNDEEIATNMDARLMRLIQDARKHNSVADVTDKKVKKEVPKFVKPSKAGDRPSLQKARAAKAQKDNIRKSGGSVDSVAAAILDRM
jgi:hypothetical protein